MQEEVAVPSRFIPSSKKRKEKASKSGAEKAYITSWPYYELMMFIDDCALTKM